MALDVTSFAYALKAHYDSKRMEQMTLKDNPLLALVAKKTDFGGDGTWTLPVMFAGPQRTSADFAKAQANTSTSKGIKFLIPRKSEYSFASIKNEVMEASEGNANAFMEAATLEIDQAINSSSRSIAAALYGSGSGSLGQIANISTAVITLADSDSVMNFEVGMKLELSATDGSGSVRSGTITIAGVDRDAGTITASAAVTSGISAAAVNDYIFKEGDYNNKITGLAGWIPATAPTGSDSFFGVNRSQDATRLAGIRFNGTAMPIEEALNKTAARLAREGSKPTHVFMNFTKWSELVVSLGTKVQYVDVRLNAEIGFQGVQINGPNGAIKVVPDLNCPGNRAYMLQLDTLTLKSLKAMPRILDADGNKMLREASADAYEVRIGGYGNLGCHAPGYNAVILL